MIYWKRSRSLEAVEGKLDAVAGGPNCRTRSVLRHYPIPDVEDYPKPLRSWDEGQHYGLKDLSFEDRQKVEGDDILMWRMIFLYMVATYVRRAQGVEKRVAFPQELHARMRLNLGSRRLETYQGRV